MKETERTNKWEAIPCPKTGRTSVIKGLILLMASCTFNAIPKNILMTFFAEVEKTILKSACSHKSHQ
jgi:hypothetical protein